MTLRERAAAVRRATTPAGRAVTPIGLAAAVLGVGFGWVELDVVAAACLTVVMLGAIVVLLPRWGRVDFEITRRRVASGQRAPARLTVAAGALPVLASAARVPVAEESVGVRLPLVWRHRTRDVALELPVFARGVYRVGPVQQVSRDALGLFERVHSGSGEHLLYVRPRTVSLESLSTGVISDVDGVESDALTPSGLSFHTLREYVAGDDLRQVHWRSSARADRLLVREYLDHRRTRATLIVDDDPAAYGDSETYELAVSIAASIGVRAVYDDFDVTLWGGDQHVSSGSAEVLLDRCCALTTGAGRLRAQAARVASAMAGSSLVVVVTGDRVDAASAYAVMAAFPAEAGRIVVRAAPDERARSIESGGIRLVVCPLLDHLGRLLSGTLAGAAR